MILTLLISLLAMFITFYFVDGIFQIPATLLTWVVVGFIVAIATEGENLK